MVHAINLAVKLLYKFKSNESISWYSHERKQKLLCGLQSSSALPL